MDGWDLPGSSTRIIRIVPKRDVGSVLTGRSTQVRPGSICRLQYMSASSAWRYLATCCRYSSVLAAPRLNGPRQARRTTSSSRESSQFPATSTKLQASCRHTKKHPQHAGTRVPHMLQLLHLLFQVNSTTLGLTYPAGSYRLISDAWSAHRARQLSAAPRLALHLDPVSSRPPTSNRPPRRLLLE